MSRLLQRPYRANLEVEHIPKTVKSAKNSLFMGITEYKRENKRKADRMRNSVKGARRDRVAHRLGVLCQVRARASALVADLAIFQRCK